MSRDLNYMDVLNEELDSICKPKLTNLSEASAEDIMRDLHRVITGNGGSTKGLIFKQAAANASLVFVRSDISDMDKLLAAQVKRCDEVQTEKAKKEAVCEARNGVWAKVAGAIFINRSPITIAIAALLLHFGGSINGSVDQDGLIKTIDNLLELKVRKAIATHHAVRQEPEKAVKSE